MYLRAGNTANATWRAIECEGKMAQYVELLRTASFPFVYFVFFVETIFDLPQLANPAVSANPSTFSVNPGRTAVGVLLGALIALLLYFVFYGGLNADEGFYLLASRLVSEGARLYRDFGFTQGPVLPWANLPWLELFGFTLDGQRMASLIWALAAVGVGLVWLLRRRSPSSGALFLLLLIGTPGWAEYAVKGKTYGFGSLCVIVGVCALISDWKIGAKWTVFAGAAAVGIGARYPLAAFFVPGGFCLLASTPTWRLRAAIVAVCAVAAAAELTWACSGDWSAFVFWTAGFHRESLFHFSLAERFVECLCFGAGLWIGAGIIVFARKGRFFEEPIILLLGLAVLINVGFSSTYTEYIVPFLPAVAMTLAPALAPLLEGRWPGWKSAGVAVLLLGGWSHFPSIDGVLLSNAAKAEEFLRSQLSPGSNVVGSMPEIATAAGMKVPAAMAMGKFGVTEDFGVEIARRRRMLTPAMLSELLNDPETKAVVQSVFSSWNFVWSNPSYRALSAAGQTEIRQAINAHFFLAYLNDDYVIFLRRPSPP